MGCRGHFPLFIFCYINLCHTHCIYLDNVLPLIRSFTTFLGTMNQPLAAYQTYSCRRHPPPRQNSTSHLLLLPASTRRRTTRKEVLEAGGRSMLHWNSKTLMGALMVGSKTRSSPIRAAGISCRALRWKNSPSAQPPYLAISVWITRWVQVNNG